MRLLEIGWGLASAPEEMMLMDRLESLDAEGDLSDHLEPPDTLIESIAAFFLDGAAVENRLNHFLDRIILLHEDWLEENLCKGERT